LPPIAVAAVIAISGVAIAAGILLFGLTAAGALALYFVVWWMSLFVVLPFGIRSQAEVGDVIPGSDPGAPAAPALAAKALWTSLVATAVFLVAAWLLPLAGL
jgi:predicted secreted protein